MLLRWHTDVSELKLEKGVSIDFYNGKEDLLNFKVVIKPCDGIYSDGTFVFDFKVAKSYPHDAPKVLCETTVFHPNIDMEGHVCLNILREDWKPVLTIGNIIMGLQFLMPEPNADDPLNKEVCLSSNDHVAARFGQPHITARVRRGHMRVVGTPLMCSDSPVARLTAVLARVRTSQAAALLSENRRRFEQTVRETFKGRSMRVGGTQYDFPRFT